MIITQTLVFVFLVLFTYAFFLIIYEGVKNQDQTKFSYALFAANAIICNSLFAFGRSTIFMERHDAAAQKLIYLSATKFLTAAIISFFVSGWVYANTDAAFMGQSFAHKSALGYQIILISLAISLGIVIIFSIAGLYFFSKWFLKSFEKTVSSMEENRSKF